MIHYNNLIFMTIVYKNRHKILRRDLVHEVSLYYNKNTEIIWKGVYQSWDL